MSTAKKYRPGWDSAFFVERSQTGWKPQPRRESERLPDIPFSFDWVRIKRAWETIGVTWLDETQVKIHIVELAMWERGWKK